MLLRLGVTSTDALRSWVLGLLDHAEVVGPPDLRAGLVAWLESMARDDEVDRRVHPPGGAGGRPGGR